MTTRHRQPLARRQLPRHLTRDVGALVLLHVADERAVRPVAGQLRVEELRDLIAKLDVPAMAFMENIRTITLKNGTASDLAEKLKDLWQQSRDQAEGDAGGLKLEIPAIVADARSNSLIVAASKSDFEAIKSVVDKIEALELNPMANIYIVRLQHNSAQQFATAGGE